MPEAIVRMLGRVDDVMNVSGHRISTTEVESALVAHVAVAEAAVVGATDVLTGQTIVALMILRSGATESSERQQLTDSLKAQVGREIGAISKPKRILFVSEPPKTRSGKIVRRLLRDIVDDRELGDMAALSDASVMRVISDRLAPTQDGHVSQIPSSSE
jgi:acetyl-CoA synthetase